MQSEREWRLIVDKHGGVSANERMHRRIDDVKKRKILSQILDE